MNNIKIKLFKDIIIKVTICTFLLFNIIDAQTTPELQTAVMKLGHIWLGVSANGYRSNFDYLTGFFPSDYDIMANRGQYAESYTGAGVIITALHWFNPIADSVQPVAQYSYTNNLSSDWGAGKVLVPITNYLRYGFPKQVVNFNEVPLDNFATLNPGYSKFQNHTYDEICEVTDSTVFGVNVYRKLLAWSQNYNDNYIIADLTFTNASSVTLDSVFINIHESKDNLQYSNGHNPAPGAADAFDINANNWQHYYGGRPGDSLRVFYEYSADNPQKAGDNMGAPATTQRGRLLDPNMTFFAILHASKEPYTDPDQDVDDPLQPKITYSGAPNYFPRAVENDVYNSSNFYVIRGGFSDDNPMSNSYPGTHHEVNSDELGLADNSAVPAARPQNPAYRYVSFGPYNFAPGQKIHIVYASGYAGIGFKKGQEIGQKWINGTLQDPPNMPDPNTGWLPSNFQFPPGATEMDKRKDRWISTGIDSVMLSAYRAQWNYDHNYNIPQAPPPPATATVTGYGDGVQIEWTDPEAESMPNFAGYRIMSRITSDDTIFYKVVYESDSSDKAAHHSIKLTNVIPSAQYYYYIQSKAKIGENDPNADPTTRGKIMYSGRLLYPNIDFVQPPRFGGQPDLSKIRIVPNPYNINDPLLLKFYSDTQGRNITFYNLPSFCTIKIYTENGDLIQTIDHNNPLGLGSETWDMLTSSQQAINSGVYIAVFTKPDGELSYQKFVVVR